MIARHFVDQLREVVEANPDAIAVACSGEPAMDYAQLWTRATSLAAAIAEAGAERGEAVALHVERSPDFIIGMVASWLAGTAWVPVLPELPEARRRLIVDETRARVAVVASDRVPAWLHQRCRVIDARSAGSARQLVAERALADRAYLIYTSGSTGRPKGVVVSHRGLVPMLEAQIAAFELRAGDRCLWMLSPGFDASVSDVGTALLAGATIHIEHPARLRSGSGLVEVLRQRAITHVDLPPSLLPLLPLEPPPSLRTIVVGGEVCAPAAIRAWASRVRVVNVYGPTEATVCTSLAICDASWQRPLLGSTLPHVTCEVVDDELQIAGPGLADGYLDRPQLEATKFVQRAGRRWFRTGDRVRLIDGALEFVGRLDRQLKIAGVLVAPEEIEARLRDHAELVDAVVTAELAGTRSRLVTHYVAARDLDAELRDHLAHHLDARLVPRRFVRVPSIARTASGKLTLPPALADRGQDLQPAGIAEVLARTGRSGLEPLVTTTERSLAAIWERLLGIAPSRDDDFFALGGDSLAVIEHVGLAELAGLAMTAEQLYAHPTLAGLAQAIDNGAPHPTPSCASLVEDLAILRFAPERPRARVATTPDPVPDLHVGASVLTGASGFLGAHVLVELVARTSGPIVCLVREPTKLIGVLRGVVGGERAIAAMASRVRVIASDVTAPRLGVGEALWEELARTATAIVHCAADVSLAKPYRALRAANVDGTARVLELAAAGRAEVHHASTLSVFVGSDRAPGVLRESDALETAGRLHGGYAQSKWAAEWLAREAGASVYRFGLLTGDTRTGRAPPRDWLTWFLRGLARVGAVPRLDRELRVDITPIDHASRAFAALIVGAPRARAVGERVGDGFALAAHAGDKIAREGCAARGHEGDKVAREGSAARELADGAFASAARGPTFHIANSRSATLEELVAALRRAGIALDEVAIDAWPATVAAAGDTSPELAAALLGLCRGGAAYDRARACDVFQATGFQFDTSRTDAVVGPCPPPSAALLDLYVRRALEGDR